MFNINGKTPGILGFSEQYSTLDGKYAGAEFDLLPKQINIIEVTQYITLPFYYHLDTLSEFSKANYEKITIYGDRNVDIEFNEYYPFKKVSNDKWVWEYSNIDTKDKNLQNFITIKSKENSNGQLNLIKQKFSFAAYKILFIGGLALILLIIIILFFKRIKR